jgi:hypothetical protein
MVNLKQGKHSDFQSKHLKQKSLCVHVCVCVWYTWQPMITKTYSRNCWSDSLMYKVANSFMKINILFSMKKYKLTVHQQSVIPSNVIFSVPIKFNTNVLRALATCPIAKL